MRWVLLETYGPKLLAAMVAEECVVVEFVAGKHLDDR